MKARYCMLFLAAAIAYPMTSLADPDARRNDDVATITVSLADLDMSRPAGVNVLYKRIRAAAGAVCRLNQSREPERVAASRTCYRSSIDNAVAQVNEPLLMAMHERRSGKQEEILRAAKR